LGPSAGKKRSHRTARHQLSLLKAKIAWSSSSKKKEEGQVTTTPYRKPEFKRIQNADSRGVFTPAGHKKAMIPTAKILTRDDLKRGTVRPRRRDL